MHYTAMEHGRLFFEAYANSQDRLKIIDIGAQDVNGSLRSVAPAGCDYIGVDFVSGKGVDVIIDDATKLPFDDNSVDICVSSSCFEHAEFFWMSFIEIIRILRPGGLFYLNAPSNGGFHRYPVDCWRFYPDSGTALNAWARKQGYDTVMLESFTGSQNGAPWNDFVAIFLKDSAFVDRFPNRIIDGLPEFTNGLVHGENGFRHMRGVPEDMAGRLRLVETLQEKAARETAFAEAEAKFRHDVLVLETELAKREGIIENLTARLISVEKSKAYRVLKKVRRLISTVD